MQDITLVRSPDRRYFKALCNLQTKLNIYFDVFFKSWERDFDKDNFVTYQTLVTDFTWSSKPQSLFNPLSHVIPHFSDTKTVTLKRWDQEFWRAFFPRRASHNCHYPIFRGVTLNTTFACLPCSGPSRSPLVLGGCCQPRLAKPISPMSLTPSGALKMPLRTLKLPVSAHPKAVLPL